LKIGAFLLSMEWTELDLDLAQWNIPAEKMKMKLSHIVPLPCQAIHVLNEIKPLTGQSKYVFRATEHRYGA
jgi:integrase